MLLLMSFFFFFFSSRRRHTRYWRDWSSDVCSSDLMPTNSPPRLTKSGPHSDSSRPESGHAAATFPQRKWLRPANEPYVHPSLLASESTCAPCDPPHGYEAATPSCGSAHVPSLVGGH